ncbi:MAG: triphosphoribosyl-dephospho-CoA synthase MdcB [Verrucomicrobia bacterium]|nr:triphosphoribosyl-dephospho-CoA synthase MdcB [Verrucomicrobiota bacterium]
MQTGTRTERDSGGTAVRDADAVPGSGVLADLAVQALRDEAVLTPKPGLVDRRGSAAHDDMDVALLLRSADSLRPTFAAIARTARDREPSAALQASLAEIGRAGEREMLDATGGVNTHRGAIWTLGLLVGSAAMGPGTAGDWCRRAATLAGLHDCDPDAASNGLRVKRRFGSAGARGEAEDGFPHILRHGLPTLRRVRAQGGSETRARLDALLAIIAELDDTCLLHRGGRAGLDAAKQGARQVLSAGGAASDAGFSVLVNFGAELVRRRLSPGGSADLLAGVLFLDALENLGEPSSDGKTHF